MSYVVTKNTATIIIGGKQHTLTKDHPNFYKIRQGILDEIDVTHLLDVSVSINTIKDFHIGEVESKGDVLMYKGVELHNTLTNRIISLHYDGEDITQMVAFLSNLMENPSATAIEEFYGFLEHGQLPITEDGYFLAYKKINSNFTDCFSGTFDNSVGKVVSMPRNMVDDRRDNTCSHGLHFCSKDYLPNFGNSGDNIVVVLKINPKDVVSIPSDYHDTKGRCCEYTVLCELEDYHDDLLFNKNIIKSDVIVDIDMTIRQKIAVATVDKVLKRFKLCTSIYSGEVDLHDLITINPEVYDDAINSLKNAFDKPITRDRAVKHFKFVKNRI